MIAFYGDKKFADLYNMNRLQIQNDIVLHIEDIRQENLKNIINNLIQAKNKNWYIKIHSTLILYIGLGSTRLTVERFLYLINIIPLLILKS